MLNYCGALVSGILGGIVFKLYPFGGCGSKRTAPPASLLHARQRTVGRRMALPTQC